MGQRLSKEIARLDEISDEKRKNSDRLHTLFPLAADEAAAGKPATPGSHQARRDAAWAYSMQLSDESNAIFARLIAKGEGRSLPMPDPTPPLSCRRRLSQTLHQHQLLESSLPRP
jgi:hypothetical protein